MAVSIASTNNPGNFPQNWVPSPAGGPVIKIWIGSLKLDFYTTGGLVLSPSLFGMTTILSFIPATASNSNLTANVAGALKMFVSTTGAEVANAVDLTAVTCEMVVVGL